MDETFRISRYVASRCLPIFCVCSGIMYSVFKVHQGLKSVFLNMALNPLGLSGLEPPTSRLSGVRSNRLSYKPVWRRRDSNSRPPACKAGALPTELRPRKRFAGGLLLSHAVSSVVPSAACVLTIVFGMGTGVPRRRIATSKLELYHVQLNSKTHHALSRSLLVYS